MVSHDPVADDHTSWLESSRRPNAALKPKLCRSQIRQTEPLARAVMPDAVAKSSLLAEMASALTESKCPDLTTSAQDDG